MGVGSRIKCTRLSVTPFFISSVGGDHLRQDLSKPSVTTGALTMQNGSERPDQVVQANARGEASGTEEPRRGPRRPRASPSRGRRTRCSPRFLRLHGCGSLSICHSFSPQRLPRSGAPQTQNTPVKANEFDLFGAGYPLWEAAARGPLLAPLPQAPPPRLVLAGGPRAACRSAPHACGSR